MYKFMHVSALLAIRFICRCPLLPVASSKLTTQNQERAQDRNECRFDGNKNPALRASLCKYLMFDFYLLARKH